MPKKVFRFVFFLGNVRGAAGNDQARFFQERFGLVPAGVLQGTVPKLAHGNNVVLVLAEDQNTSNKGVLCKDGSSRFWLVGTRLKTLREVPYCVRSDFFSPSGHRVAIRRGRG